MSKRRREVEGHETRWQGLGVSDGVVIGRVLRVFNGARQVYRATLDEKDVEREVRRFRAAIRLARRQLLAIKTLKIDFASAEAVPSVRSSLSAHENALAVRTRSAAALACKPKRFVITTRCSII